METISACKQMESTLSITCDKVNTLKSKLEDLLFRAQRISAAQKNNMPNSDTMYGYDLQKFRRDIRTFSTEISGKRSGIENSSNEPPTSTPMKSPNATLKSALFLKPFRTSFSWSLPPALLWRRTEPPSLGRARARGIGSGNL
jgi:hypothetical protein